MKPSRARSSPPSLATLLSLAKSEATLEYAWKLDAKAFPDGSAVVFWAEATNNRDLTKVLPSRGRRTTRTPVFQAAPHQ